MHFDLVHYDIWGAYYVTSFCGARYFLAILDDASICVWIYLMKKKSEASQIVKNLCAMMQTQSKTKVKVIRIDNGTSGPMKQFYAKKGIIHETSCVDTPQQKGRVERKHCHVLNVA